MAGKSVSKTIGTSSDPKKIQNQVRLDFLFSCYGLKSCIWTSSISSGEVDFLLIDFCAIPSMWILVVVVAHLHVNM